MEYQLQLTALRMFILFMLAAASGISAANPCTVLLCSLPLPLNEIEQNISTLLQDVVSCMLQLGRTPKHPGWVNLPVYINRWI